MGERRGRGRIGEIVGGHVNGLHRGDRTLVGRRDALLQSAHVGGERRLIAHGRRDAAEQSGHFGTGLGEAEDVVHEEQHVLAFDVAEIFGDGEARQGDACAGAGRFVHLAIDQGDLRTFGDGVAIRVRRDNAGFEEFVIKIIAFAGALTHAGEHRGAAVALGDVVDQFLNQHGLADAGAAEQADLAALGVRRQQIDDLNASDQNAQFGRLIDEFRGLGMNRGGVGLIDRAALVDRLTDDVHDAAQRGRADRNADLAAGVGHFLAAHHAVGGVHGDAAHGAFT